mmetsp:Transcript_9201/g.16838  ORF Transcript_9201/g.16838 Transcript_9201/m.16838 type:complete len:472 (+) Transcript_9201:59-1474(+)
MEESLSNLENEKAMEVEFLQEEHSCIVSDLQEQVAGLQSSLDKEMKDKDERRVILEGMGSKNTALTQELNGLKELLATHDEEKDDLNQKLEVLTQTLKTERSSHNALSSENAAKIHKLEKAAAQDKEEMVRLNIELKHMKKQTKADKKARNMLRKGFEDQIDKLDASLVEERKQYEKRAKFAAGTLKKVEATLDDLRKENQLLRDSMAESKMVRESAEERAEKAEAAATKTKKQVDKGVMRALQLETEAKLLGEENAELKERVDELQKTWKRLEAEKSALEGDCSALNMSSGIVKDQLEKLTIKANQAEREKAQSDREVRRMKERMEEFKLNKESAVSDKRTSDTRIHELETSIQRLVASNEQTEENFQNEKKHRMRLEANGNTLIELAKRAHKDSARSLQNLSLLYKAVDKLSKNAAKKGSQDVIKLFSSAEVQAVMKKSARFIERRSKGNASAKKPDNKTNSLQSARKI